jgi:RNA polymerase sigma-70 factor (ECF subfamily)
MLLPHVAAGPAPAPDDGALEQALARLLEAARGAWPRLSISDEAFLRYVAERLVPAEPLPEQLAAIHAPDLFLACGCLQGEPAAMSAFDDRFITPLRRLAARARSPSASVDDVLQEIRARLLVARGEGAARLASYNGRGSLNAWVRVAAARLAIDLHRARSNDEGSAPADAPIRAPGDDPEIELLKQRYRPELETAFRATLAALPDRDANILRLHYLDGLTGEKIAAIYGKHPRTVKQWLAQARHTILRDTRRLLAGRLQLSASQLDAVLGLVQSQLEVSLHVLLKRPDK